MQAAIGHLEEEEARALFMDREGRLLAEVVFNQRENDGVEISARKVAAIIQIVDASIMLLVHNHPSGTCAPSQSDIETTQAIVRMLGTLGVTLYDHIIVTRAETYSFRAQGYL